MSYEQSCEDFAAFGDPAREAYDYEERARYDYVNEAYGDSGDAMQDWMDSLEDDDFDDDDYLDEPFDFGDFPDFDDDDVPF